MIRRLAYVSRPRIDLAITEIPRIVAVSRINNQRDDLSGVLIYTGTDFAQVIEGSAAHVGELWRRIRSDERHLDLTLLLDEQDSTRWFSDWRMGYLEDRGLARKFADWRNLDQAIAHGERMALRTLFVAADSL